MTGRRAWGVIALCWLLSIIIGLTPMGWSHQVASNDTCPSGLVSCRFTHVVTMEYMVYFNFFGFVLPPLLLMFAIYLCIFLAARRQLQWMDAKGALGAAGHGEKCRSKLQKELHAAKSLAIIVGLFTCCWLPLHVLNCYTLFINDKPDGYEPPGWLMYIAIILSHANSVVNPFIYAYRIREYRHTFRKIVRHHLLGRHIDSQSVESYAHSCSTRLNSSSLTQQLFAEPSSSSPAVGRSPAEDTGAPTRSRPEVSEVGTLHLAEQPVAF